MNGAELLAVVKRCASARCRLRREDFEDLVQDAAVTGLRAIRAFDPRKGGLRRFVTLRIDGEVISRLRQVTRHGRKVQVQFEPFREDAHTERCASLRFVAPPEQAEQAEQLDRLLSAIRVLPWQWRLVTRARVRGIPYRQLAIRLGVSETRVWQLRNKARKQLHGTLAQYRGR